MAKPQVNGVVEVLAAYSHSGFAADLVQRPAVGVRPQHSTRPEQPQRKPSWSLRDRLSDDVVGTIVDDYREGRTARQLSESYNVSVSSIKRLLRERGVRKATAQSDPTSRDALLPG